MARYQDLIDLHIHVDYNISNHSRTDILDDMAKSFEWKHGEKKIIRHTLRKGMRRSWLEISPDCTRISAITVLEGDLIVSVNWHEWYTMVWSWVQAHDNINETDILGVSLTPLAKNHLTFPFKKWAPNTSQGLYLHQVPSSWGTVFSCSAWRSFLNYAEIRDNASFEYEQMQGTSMLGVRPGDPNFNIPGLHSNWWAGSWQKYMIEFSVLSQKYFVYPNLHEEKKGFAMEASEQNGEHVISSKEFENAIHHGKLCLPGLSSDLRMYDVYFDDTATKKTFSISTNFINHLNEKGGPYGQIVKRIVPSSMTLVGNSLGRKYLMYLPEFGVNNQIISLAIAIKISITLKRVLVIPHLFHPRRSFYTSCIGDDRCLEFSDFFSLEDLYAIVPNFAFVILTAGNLPYYKPKRIVELSKPNLFDKREEIYFQKLARSTVPETAFMKFIMEAKDSILLLDNIYFANVFFSQEDLEELRRVIMTPNTRLRELTQQVKQNLDLYPKICVHLRYTDFNDVCNRFENSENPFYKRMKDQGYVCMLSDEEVQNIVNKSSHSGQVLLATDDPKRVEALSINNTKILTSKHIEIEVKNLLPLGSHDFLGAAQSLVEQQICSQSETAVLNRLSTFSLNINILRDRKGVKWLSREFLSAI